MGVAEIRLLVLSIILHLAASRRHLQSSSVSISSGTHIFENVLDLSSSVRGRTLKLLYTLTADGTLRAALVADIEGSEYAGLSFGTPHRASSPTIIFTHEFIDGYYLRNYDTANCNAGKGSWAVTDAALEVDGSSGLLVGLFTSTGIKSGRQTIGYTFGPYSDGTLGDHTRPRNKYPYSSVQATLSVSTGASSGTPAPATPSPATPSPAATAPEAPAGSTACTPPQALPTATSTPGATTAPTPAPLAAAGTANSFSHKSKGHDDDDEEEEENDEEEEEYGHRKDKARGTATATVTTTSPSPKPTAAPCPAPSPSPSPSPKPTQASAGLGQSSQALTMTEWVQQTAATDWRLMMAFVVSWAAAPGVALLVWPFVFDAAMDVGVGVQALTGRRAIHA